MQQLNWLLLLTPYRGTTVTKVSFMLYEDLF